MHDRRVYLIGIGGCGMSGLARMLRAQGAHVCGSDCAPSDVTERLEAEGFEVAQISELCPPDVDCVIASAAIQADHPQLVNARRRGIVTMTYAEALGRLMAERTGVAVAGTHGKSTTTAMLGTALVDAGLDPGVIVGAECAQLAAGALHPDAGPVGYRVGAWRVPAGSLAGRPGLMVAEACEFNRSFHNLRPTVAAVTCVEADHLDVYGGLEQVVEAFHVFARLLPPASDGGQLLIGHANAHRREVCAGTSCAVSTIGIEPDADWCVQYDAAARRVRMTHRGTAYEWTMRMPGLHNAINAATACAMAIMLGAEPETGTTSLSAFAGLDRRMQRLGERRVAGGVVRVIDDYGHHPTEIEATLRAARESELTPGGRLICVFQPHQHSRTRFLLDAFADAFSAADIVIVPDIYFVRDSEAERHSVCAADLVDRLRDRAVHAMHVHPFDAIVEELEVVCRAGDLLVVMGAGPVWQVAHQYMRAGSPAPDARTVGVGG